MNNTYILLMLVNTLTKAEKRYFHLCANLQNGDKVYLTLFNLIDANTSPEQLYTRFCQIQWKNMENKKEEPTLNKVTFVNGVQIKNKSGKH